MGIGVIAENVAHKWIYGSLLYIRLPLWTQSVFREILMRNSRFLLCCYWLKRVEMQRHAPLSALKAQFC